MHNENQAEPSLVRPPLVAEPDEQQKNLRRFEEDSAHEARRANSQQHLFWMMSLARWGSFLLLMAVIWGGALFYIIHLPKSYESKWRIILPGEGVSTALKLNDVGEAKTASRSLFMSKDFDPRATYREIALSNHVRKAAATNLDLNYADFQPPKVKAIPQTAILEFRIKGSTPEDAHARALAFVEAFEGRVEKLRTGEVEIRQKDILGQIDDSRQRLDGLRTKQLMQQQKGGLLNLEQYSGRVAASDQLKRELVLARIDLETKENAFRSLAEFLGVSEQVAAWALTLKSDRQFQALSKSLVEAEVNLANLRSIYGERHPEVIKGLSERNTFVLEANRRSVKLIGREVPDELAALLDLTFSDERSQLFADLIASGSELNGARARVLELEDAYIEALASVMSLAEEAAALEDIERDYQIAEAIFASALARIDLSSVDPYASYPLFQALDTPTFPSSNPAAPKKLPALAGASAATFLILLAYGALWYRRRILRLRLRKKPSSGR